jgi:hypothetical protein
MPLTPLSFTLHIILDDVLAILLAYSDVIFEILYGLTQVLSSAPSLLQLR